LEPRADTGEKRKEKGGGTNPDTAEVLHNKKESRNPQGGKKNSPFHSPVKGKKKKGKKNTPSPPRRCKERRYKRKRGKEKGKLQPGRLSNRKKKKKKKRTPPSPFLNRREPGREEKGTFSLSFC